MNANSIRRFLEDQGYLLLERVEVWAECLLLRDGERWIGRGRDRDEALFDAVAAAFPSQAARRALEAMLDREEAPAEVMPVAAPAEQIAAEPVDAEPAGAEAEAEPEVAAPPQEFLLESTPLPEPAAAPPPASAPAAAPPTRPSEAAIVAELADLERRIREDHADLAIAAPHRQRLAVLGLLASARACQEEAPRNAVVAGTVARIVRELRIRVEAWWPGRIAAFQLRARPADAWRDLRDGQTSSHADWRAVADAAAQALRRTEAEDSSEGRDAHGWADAASLLPRPSDPEGLFADLLAEVEEAGGEVRGKQPQGQPAPDGARLLAWSQQARWLRGAVEGERWGALVGRLRYWSQLGPTGHASREVLDPGYRPQRKWSTELLSAEEQERRGRELSTVLAAVPQPGAEREAVIGWLLQALPLTTDFADAIAASAAPHRTSIESVQESELPGADRRIRRRLQRLKKALSGEATQPPAAIDAAPEAPELELDSNTTIPDAILERTAGRRVLFVSNRTEVDLQERLIELYRFGALAWEEVAPRRIAAAVQAIASGSYDLVLGATGFMGHVDDNQLARACRSAGIPYVRVDKGKPTGVRLALERDLVPHA